MATPDTFSQAETQAKSYEIDSNAASITVYAVPAGRKFVVYDLFLQAEGANDLRVKSGTTNLTGLIAFTANSDRRWNNSGFPVFVGRGDGDDFIISNPGTVQVNGWALIKEVQYQ